ncbi:MAG TPA: MurT ligase domain-containing protein [Mycobacterium sp.]|nr:MurT ligase domain-containing protein [Mycobacterium sp.]
MVTIRGRVALAAGAGARWASRVTGRGAGAMIGGLVAMTLDKSILRQLGEGRRTVVVTGTNGKSTTTRMTAAALGTLGASEPQGRRGRRGRQGRRGRRGRQGRRGQTVATNAEGANMDAGLVAALAGARDAGLAALEVDEMHVPHVADAVDPAVIVLLNLSRDQLDRVGEINHIERTLRGGLARHPSAVVVANCDDVLMTSAAYDSPHVVWVAAGGGWANDSVSCPRSGEIIVRDGTHWYSTGTDFKRPTPQWWFDDANIYGPDGLFLPTTLALPGTVNRGNATLAVAAAVTLGADPAAAVAAVSGVDEVAGRYRTVQLGAHTVRMLLAKNPAGWQEALSMVDTDAGSVVISVNGQVPDGEDLSWLWDVNFEHFVDKPVVAAGERGTDLAVRLGYAGVEHSLVHNAVEAIASCPPGHVEVVANYTAFLQLNRTFGRGGRGPRGQEGDSGRGDSGRGDSG